MIVTASVTLLHLTTVGTATLWTRWKGEEQVLDENKMPEVSFERRSSRMRRAASGLIRGKFRERRRRPGSSRKTPAIEQDLHNPYTDPARQLDDNSEAAYGGSYTAAINAKSSEIVQSRLRARAAAAADAAGAGAEATAAAAAEQKVNVLILMSDTGGGHRASAQALEAAFEILYPGKIKVTMVDVLTEHTAWPVNESVAAYQYAAKNPLVWRTMYEVARFPPTRWANDKLMVLQNFARLKAAIDSYTPDMVISVHPLCQHLPLKVCLISYSDLYADSVV
jgi:Monogalactosyldiacylglycerol (MGDG) synthase